MIVSITNKTFYKTFDKFAYNPRTKSTFNSVQEPSIAFAIIHPKDLSRFSITFRIFQIKKSSGYLSINNICLNNRDENEKLEI